MKSAVRVENGYYLNGAANNNKMISDEFDPEIPYSKGRLCINNNTLYRFTDDKAAGEWDDTIVEETNIANELGQINSDLSELLRGSVTVTAVNGDTFGSIVNKLFAAMDVNKLTYNSYFVAGDTNYVFRIIRVHANPLFAMSGAGTGGANGESVAMSNSSIWYVGVGTTLTQKQTTALPTVYLGDWTLYY